MNSIQRRNFQKKPILRPIVFTGKLNVLFEHIKVEHWTKVSADLNQATYDYVEYKVSLSIFYNINYI